ncbi:MAG: hypothetical protein J5379_01960 [Clostridiales bacterium]|nr:hypothetical protein [Clostridiales bacterium]
MEIAFHCPNCLADLIFDESKSYTCCFCHTVFTGKHEVKELEGGYYVGDAWNDKVYHTYHCEDCGSDFIAKPGTAQSGCPMCSSSSVKDNGGMVGAMPRRAIPFAHTKQQAQEMFLDYIRNNSAVGRTLATDENKELLHKVYVPIFLFTYEVVAHARLTAVLRNKANEGMSFMGINAPDQLVELLSPIRSSISRFQANRKGAKDTASQPSEHVTGGVLSWQGIPFDASGILQSNVMNMIQPYDQSKMVLLNEKVLMDTPVLAITKDPVTCMQEFMERIKKWTRQMIMDAHSDSYDISYFQDKTDYPLGIGELVLFPIWYMKGEYMGREFFFAMNGQNGEVDANIPMSKGTTKNVGITYQQYWDKSRCTALNDTHFEFNIHDPNIEILDYSFFEKPRESRVTPEGRKKPEEDSMESFIAKQKGKNTVSLSKPGSALDIEVGPAFRNRDPNKKMTKEEELQHEREVTARLRVAAKEEPKGDMAAASSIPSWAKAVTPPPSASQPAAGGRAARTKKPALEKPSKLAASNKPLWEKAEEGYVPPDNTKPMSLADWMASGNHGDPNATDIKPFAPGKTQDEEDTGDADLSGILKAAQQAEAEFGAAMASGALSSADNSGSDMVEQASREQIVSTSSVDLESAESYEIPMPKVTIPVEEEVAEAPVEEVPFKEVPFEEVSETAGEEEMMANITFSFNKKKPAFSGEEKPATATSIPRRPEKDPEMAQGMAIMNSEYDSGVLRSSESKSESLESESREILPKSQLASENYIGSEQNDRPLAYRPLAPLAQQRADMFVEEVETHPELDENNRPLASRPPAPLARMDDPGPTPTLEYLADKTMDEDLLQMPSPDKKKSKWGDMPEATETPAWAKPQHEEEEAPRSPFARTAAQRQAAQRPAAQRPTAQRPAARSEEEEESPAAPQRPGMGRPAARPAAERPAQRPGMGTTPAQRPGMGKTPPSTGLARPGMGVARPASARDTAEQNTERPAQRPGMGRPAARTASPESETESPAAAQRPGMGRPAARPAAAAKPKSNENVPLWERAPQTDGPFPAWGASAAFQEDRPRGSLMKPKGQVIDVEKPREKPSLWRPDGEVKEILPGGARGADEDARSIPARGEAREVVVNVGRSDEPREIPVRPSSGVDVEIGSTREPKVNRSVEMTEDESSPIVFSSDRPRTYAQRRQMEEEERRRSEQSPFARAERPAGRPGMSRPGMRQPEPEEEQPINKTFEPTQFENKPSVVASLDMLPEPLPDDQIHGLAKDTRVPGLAIENDELRKELADGERRAQRAIRDLPDFDPDGPSPFKPN